jgi:hypothetical protein
MPLRGDIDWVSFNGMGKSFQNDRGVDSKTDAPAHRLDEFPAGYSLTGCSPAEPAFASPAGVDYASGPAQVRGIRGRGKKEKRIPTISG